MSDPYIYVWTALVFCILNAGMVLGSERKDIIDKVIYVTIYALLIAWQVYILSNRS